MILAIVFMQPMQKNLMRSLKIFKRVLNENSRYWSVPFLLKLRNTYRGLLKERKIAHEVLNAKQHEREAQIVAEAGRPGAVTIATNMAGRGTDIVLGGKLARDASDAEKLEWQHRHDEAISAGGLHIIGTERHESRRIDNQLRGRSARQGDPGSTRFYLSLKDNLMRIFVSDNIAALLNRFGFKDSEVLTHPVVTRAVENAQRKVEGHNFDVRKQLLEFDDVANDQRKVIYHQRNELLADEDIHHIIQAIRLDVIVSVFHEYIPKESFDEQWNVEGLERALEYDYGTKLNVSALLAQDQRLEEEKLKSIVVDAVIKMHEAKELEYGESIMRHLEKNVMLNVVDTQWREHLAAMDYMRHSIHLRGYAQQDPKQEYKREAFVLFSEMLEHIKRETIRLLAHVQVNNVSEEHELLEQHRREAELQNLHYTHEAAPSVLEPLKTEENIIHGIDSTPYIPTQAKLGRNELCHCGSGLRI